MSADLASPTLHLYAYPSQVQPGHVMRVEHHQFNSLRCSDAALAATSFQCSFEQAVDRLQMLDRMFTELDGSFLWAGHHADFRWQIDGMLYDDGRHLKRVELKGCCPRPAWQQLLSCFDWPTQRVLAHWIERSCFVEVESLFQADFFLRGDGDPV